jgi:hypothetical protein
MTVQRPAALLAILTLLLSSVPRLQAQEPEFDPIWIISAGGGGAVPMGPDYFAGQWMTGSLITGSAEYLLTPSISVGAAFNRSYFPHTGKALPYRDKPFQCLGGGDRTLTATEFRMRFYITDEDMPLRVSIIGGVGATNIFRDAVSYHQSGFTIVMLAESSVHVAATLALGAELPLFGDVSLAVEGGYAIAEDGIWVNHYVPLTAALRLRL